MTVCYQIDAESAGQRLDVYLSEHLSGYLSEQLSEQAQMTRSQVRQAIQRGDVSVNGSPPPKAGYALKLNDIVEYTRAPATAIDSKPQDIPVQILYEDSELAVIVKPQGLVVHPAAGHADSTLVNAMLFLLENLSGIGGAVRPGIVHRLDKDTSGVMLVAKNDNAHLSLSEQFRNKTVEKRYVALVTGNPKAEEGTIDAPIGRHPSDRKRMAVIQAGRGVAASRGVAARNAVTQWRVLERFNGAAFLECIPVTGRTHQIRVHLAHIGYPVMDDPVYGRGNGDKQFLHARVISFDHPVTGARMTFEAPMPERFTAMLEKLRRKGL